MQTIQTGRCQVKGTRDACMAVPAVKSQKSVGVRPRPLCNGSLAVNGVQHHRWSPVPGTRLEGSSLHNHAARRATPDVDDSSEVAHQAVILGCHCLALPRTAAKEGDGLSVCAHPRVDVPAGKEFT